MAASTSVSEEPVTRPEHEKNELLDVSLLKNIARDSLVHALNSVYHRPVSWLNFLLIIRSGQWRKNSCPRSFLSWTTQPGYGSVATAGSWYMTSVVCRKLTERAATWRGQDVLARNGSAECCDN